jgi:hypothetical protein
MYSKYFALSLVMTTCVPVFSTPILAKDLLPIDHGTYVQSRNDCADPKGTIIFIYDGKSIKSAKQTCELSNISNSGNVYKFDESCAYYHRSWSILPTTATEYKTTLEVLNKKEFLLRRENETFEFNEQYRWCDPR